MKFKYFSFVAIAALALTLVGCQPKTQNANQVDLPTALSKLTLSEANDIFKKSLANAKGIEMGPKDAKRIAVVYFDAQCPHCGDLFTSAQTFKEQVRSIWVPVGFLGPKSIEIGASILGATDPLSAMHKNEAALKAKTPFATDADAVKKMTPTIETNTHFLSGLVPNTEVTSIPFTVYQDDQGNAQIGLGSLMPAETLKTFLKL